MKTTHCTIARIVLTGFTVSLFFSVITFALNTVLRGLQKTEMIIFHDELHPHLREAKTLLYLDLSALVGDAIVSDPNMISGGPGLFCSDQTIQAEIFRYYLLESGDWITGYQTLAEQELPRRFRFRSEGAKLGIRWQANLGLVIKEQEEKSLEPETPVLKTLYIGPEGMDDKPGQQLGRFRNPRYFQPHHDDQLFVYDLDLNTFYRVDFQEAQVTSAPLGDRSISILNGEHIGKQSRMLSFSLRPALRYGPA